MNLENKNNSTDLDADCDDENGIHRDNCKDLNRDSLHRSSAERDDRDCAGTDCNRPVSATMKPAQPTKRISAIIGHFVLDQGLSGVMKFLTNGLNYNVLYEEFCDSHPHIQISFDEFKERVIESIKRTLAGCGAEFSSLIGTSGAVFTKQFGNFSNENMFLLSFSGITLSNFLTFSIAWYTSHREQFYNPDHSLDARKFAKSLIAEYGAHFGPIAVSADALESFIIHELVNNTSLNEYSIAVPVTLFCSCIAIAVYFYEQQLRVTIKNSAIGRIFDAIRVRMAQIYLPG